jgi:LPS export ABC transporter protein LptC
MIDYGMNRRKFFWILALILSVSALIIFSFNENNVKIPHLYQTSSMKQLHLKHMEGNELKWELFARTAFFPAGEKEVILDSINIKINNSPEINLTGGSGVYKIEQEEITLANPVEMSLRDTKFITDTLKLDSKDQLATTNGPIKYTGKNFLVEGTGLIAKMKQQEVKVLDDVKAIFYR